MILSCKQAPGLAHRVQGPYRQRWLLKTTLPCNVGWPYKTKWFASIQRSTCRTFSHGNRAVNLSGVERNVEAFFETKTSGKPTPNLRNECLTYATLIGENTTFRQRQCPCRTSGLRRSRQVYCVLQQEHGRRKHRCGVRKQPIQLECVNAKDNVVLSNLSDEDSCRIGKGVWEQFEWRQTPNANEALTCRRSAAVGASGTMENGRDKRKAV